MKSADFIKPLILLWFFGICLRLTLALPPLLADAGDVHRVSAGMFAIGYLCAVLIPILGGMVWDVTDIAASAFLPAAVCALVVMILTRGLDMRRPSELKAA